MGDDDGCAGAGKVRSGTATTGSSGFGTGSSLLRWLRRSGPTTVREAENSHGPRLLAGPGVGGLYLRGHQAQGWRGPLPRHVLATVHGKEESVHLLEVVFSRPCTPRRGNQQLHLLEAVLQLAALKEMRTCGLGLAVGPGAVQTGGG